MAFVRDRGERSQGRAETEEGISNSGTAPAPELRIIFDVERGFWDAQ